SNVARTSGGTAVNLFYTGLGGLPEGSSPFLVPHEALQTSYNTSGSPYFVSKIVYDTSVTGNGTSFVADTSAGLLAPEPFASGAGTSALGPFATTIGSPGPTSGTTLTNTFSFGDFTQGGQNGMFTYSQINGTSGELV